MSNQTQTASETAEQNDGFYKTLVTITVLSEGPFDQMELAGVAYAIDEGDCVGKVDFAASERVDGRTMAGLLSELDSEPGFFQLDENGNALDD